MHRAYYWYRKHPWSSEYKCLAEFAPGKILLEITDTDILRRYGYTPQLQRFFPFRLTPHGLSMLFETELSESGGTEPVIELVFELVRQIYFPKAISRLSCLFASETIEQVKNGSRYFRSILEENLGKCRKCCGKLNTHGAQKRMMRNFSLLLHPTATTRKTHFPLQPR